MPAADSSDQKALVSVIVRSVDRETLGMALSSLTAQSYRALEVVLVNAGGGRHREVAEGFPELAIRLVNQDGPPLTRPQAANAGLSAARGHYIAFLDDDDTVDPRHFEGLVRAIGLQAEDCVVYSGVRCIDRLDPEQKIERLFGTPMYSRAQLLAGNFIPIHAPLFPARLCELAHYDESLPTYEDWDFWLQLAQHARFVYTHEVTATYFTGGTSGVSPQAPDMDAVRRAMQALFEKWMRLTPDEFRNICNLYHESNAALESTRRELSIAREQLQQCEAQFRESQETLQRVYNSRSWRYSHPLRSLKRVWELVRRYVPE